MGKRELLMIVGFLVIGALVYQLAAPAAPDAEAGRSWHDVFQHIRGEMFGARARVPVERPLSVTVAAETRTLDLGEVNGRIEVVGEDRDTVEGLARLTLAGMDETDEDAKRAAEGLTLAFEPNGDRLVLKLTHKDEWRINRSGRGRPSLDVRVKIPSRLALAFDVSGVADVQDTAGVDVGGSRGSVTLRRILGAVTGSQRDGTLEVSGAKGVDLEIRRVTLRLEKVSGEVEIEATDGGIEATGLTGKTTLKTRRVGIELVDQSGPLTIEASDGRAELRRLAAETDLELTRLALQADCAKAVAISGESSDGSVDFRLPDAGLSLAIETTEGSLVGPDGLPAPSRDGVKTTLEAEWRGGGPKVKLTGARTAITLKAP
jgi:hypothetical protein